MDLPEVYYLDLSESSLGSSCEREAPIIKSTGNPLHIVSPYDLQLKFIAEKTRFSETNLHYRAVQIMESLTAPESWSEISEKRLSQTIESAGIYFNHLSLRIMLARRAVNHIVAELIDAGELSEEDMEYIENKLRFYDPRMLIIEPVSRPSCIPRMGEIEKHGSVLVDWTENLEHALDCVNMNTSDGRILLAEHTTLKCLGWQLPTEKRNAYVYVDIESTNNDTGIIQVFRNRLLDEYPFPIFLDPYPPFIISQKVYYFDTPGAGWLAINPVIAHDLGWKFARDGLFRWTNEDGDVMIESIWWLDGLMDHNPPLLDDEVGEGWLVLATSEAFGQIKDHYGSLKMQVVVEREFYQDRVKKWNKKSKQVDIK